MASYRAAAAASTELKRHLEVAWCCAVAGYELRAADRRRPHWDAVDSTYLQLLQDRANYSPSAWERDRLDALTKASTGCEDVTE